jgi:hypothetical protein
MFFLKSFFFKTLMFSQLPIIIFRNGNILSGHNAPRIRENRLGFVYLTPSTDGPSS